MTTSSICIRSMTVLERKYHTLTLATSIEAERLHAVPHASQSRAMFLNVLCCCLVAKVCLILRSHGSQHTRLSCPSLSPRACSNLCSLSQWCYSTIWFSVAAFSPPALSFSQHQGLFQGVGSSHQVAKVLQLQLQSFQWIFRVDRL